VLSGDEILCFPEFRIGHLHPIKKESQMASQPGVIQPNGAKNTVDKPKKVVTIEVRLRDLSQLFNSMDPSPFLEKELDPDAEEWIVSSAEEESEDASPRLVIHLEQPGPVSAYEEETVTNAVHVFFAHKAQLSDRRLRQLFRRGRKSLWIGLAAVAVGVTIGDLAARMLPENPAVQFVRESLIIGIWVALWRPIEIILYDWWPIRDQRKIYERLAQMDVDIRYGGQRHEQSLKSA
jgi:hypothetical protein